VIRLHVGSDGPPAERKRRARLDRQLDVRERLDGLRLAVLIPLRICTSLLLIPAAARLQRR
jgi:hypothetical protein